MLRLGNEMPLNAFFVILSTLIAEGLVNCERPLMMPSSRLASFASLELFQMTCRQCTRLVSPSLFFTFGLQVINNTAEFIFNEPSDFELSSDASPSHRVRPFSTGL